MSAVITSRPGLLFLPFLLACAAAVPAAGDWPRWRGPQQNGISTETGLLKEWPAAGPPLLWKTTGLGAGYSTVAILGERIYTSGDQGAESFVLALNRADGKPVWTAKVGEGGPVGQPKFDGPRSTPTADGDLIFVVGQWGEFLCLNSSGKEVWRKDFRKDFDGTLPAWGYAESPLVDGDRVVVTPGGKGGALVALNKKSGEILWRSTEFTDEAHYSSLVIADYGGARQYVQLTPASVAGIAAADGKLLWRATRKGRTAVIPDPVFADGHVFVTSGYGVGCDLFKVTAADGKFTTAPVYANKVMANHHGGVIKLGDYVYGHSEGKGWTCQNFLTGEAKWAEKAKLGKGSLVCADGHFYLRQESSKGTVALIEATPDGYRERGRFDPPDRSSKNSWPHPVVNQGRLYLRDQDILLCYDVKAK